MRHDVRLVKDQDHGELGAVHDTTGVSHIAHERDGRRGPRRVDHIQQHCAVTRGQRLRDDTARCRPREDFYLTRGV
jgi:hypothetical protein